jgi:phosphoribosylaminoimidazole carboxylase PurE protein
MTAAAKTGATSTSRVLVAVVMGSKSDWEVMQHTTATLNELGVAHEVRVTSAHRTPDATFQYASELAGRGIEVVIAAAGGAAHLAGVMAAKTALPVLGVPLVAGALNGLDALLATVQMPGGIPRRRPSPSASQAPSMPRCLPVRCSATSTPTCRARSRASRKNRRTPCSPSATPRGS